MEVSEEGTKAAAATAVVSFMITSVGLPPLRVKADHPFLYIIRDNDSKTYLFMGRYSAQQ